jgi:hypothetical protein
MRRHTFIATIGAAALAALGLAGHDQTAMSQTSGLPRAASR